MIKTLGYIIFAISMVIWGLIFVIPFLNYTKTQIAGIMTGLVIAGEVTFYLSIFLLGKTFYEKLKTNFSFRKDKRKEILVKEDVKQK